MGKNPKIGALTTHHTFPGIFPDPPNLSEAGRIMKRLPNIFGVITVYACASSDNISEITGSRVFLDWKITLIVIGKKAHILLISLPFSYLLDMS